MLKHLLRTALNASQQLPTNPLPIHHSNRFFASKTKRALTKAKKAELKAKKYKQFNLKPSSEPSSSTASSPSAAAAAADDIHSAIPEDAAARARRLAEDDQTPSLDVGPNGRPLFTKTPSLSYLSRIDVCSYFKFSEKELNAILPEGLPEGMIKEFDESMRKAVLVRQSFLDLRDNFRRVVDPPFYSSNAPKVRKQIVLDGPVSCGKSITLALLVHWAREEGWLVLYAPRGREWTYGGFFNKNPETGLWDTPLHAENVLKDFLKYNESRLKQLPCRIFYHVPLGEGAGVGFMKGVDSMHVPEGSTLYDLVEMGIKHTHAAVGVVVRLRKELSLVKDVPVLIAIDQVGHKFEMNSLNFHTYNSWFTFSEYEEPVTMHSRRQIHARELTLVNAFRSMMHDDMMVGAFSHSTAVGRLRKDLPDVPINARVDLPRYDLNEAAAVCHYYVRQRLIRREAFSEENWKKVYYLANGNGAEMRGLLPFMR